MRNQSKTKKKEKLWLVYKHSLKYISIDLDMSTEICCGTSPEE